MTTKAPELLELDLAQLQPAADNLRRTVGDVAELADSMKDGVGVLEPIIATPENGHYKIVAGHRRYAAAKLAGLTVVPVIVREFDDQARVAAMLIENLQHAELSSLEEAAGYRRLVDEFGLTQTQIANKVGRGQGHVSKRLALLDLPAKVKTALDSGGITIGDALELTRLNATPKRVEAAFTLATKQHYTIGQAIRHEIDEQKLEEKIAAAKTKLAGDDVKVIDLKKSTWGGWELPKGMAKLEDGRGYRYGYGELVDLAPRKHAKEPCHAAAIDPRDGDVVYICTKPARHKPPGQSTASADKREDARKDRQRDQRERLRARAKNIELGAALAAKLAAPRIDERNMRLLADLLMLEMGSELARCSFRLVDEASQTVIERKDGTVSRIAHVEGSAALQLIDDRLAAAKTPEQIMGVMLQALVAVRYGDPKALPPAERWGDIQGIRGGYGAKTLRARIEAIATASGATRAVERSTPPNASPKRSATRRTA